MAKYVHVSRDGRDVAWSAHNHFYNMSDAFYDALNASPYASDPPAARPSADRRAYFLNWLETGGGVDTDFFAFTRGWWEARHLPNVYLLHYQNLKDDLPGQVDKLAAFLEIDLDPALKERALKHVSFEHMKAHSDAMFPGITVKKGGHPLVNEGTNGRWRDELTPSDIAAYEARALAELGEDCAHWVATGEIR